MRRRRWASWWAVGGGFVETEGGHYTMLGHVRPDKGPAVQDSTGRFSPTTLLRYLFLLKYSTTVIHQTQGRHKGCVWTVVKPYY